MSNRQQRIKESGKNSIAAFQGFQIPASTLRYFVPLLPTLVVLAMYVEMQKSPAPSLLGTQPACAQAAPTNDQMVRPDDVGRLVYKQLPNLPLENQYVSQETGKVASDSTLVSRLIRYHIYVKGRPAIYRLDWKLTLADYLGANEIMGESQYPGADTLRKNPIDGDRAAIGRLNLAQRDALVQVLVNVFNPNYQATPAAPASAAPPPKAKPRPTASPVPTEPKPGDAHLLMP
jgi:hypothetical protein